MDKVSKNEINPDFEPKKRLDQRAKCKRNIWTLKMTESGEAETQPVDKTDEWQEVELQAGETHKYKIGGLEATDLEAAVEPETTDVDEIELRTIELTQSVKLGKEFHTSDLQTEKPDERKIEKLEIVQPETAENNDSLLQENIGKDNESSSDQKILVIWRHPILTLLYFTKELFLHVHKMVLKIAYYHTIPYIMIITTAILTFLHCALGSDHPTLLWAQKTFLWCLYWFSLGMLSSVGLGTGIHTFTLYLGPYIASVTVAANECGYLNFIDDSPQANVECVQDSDPQWVSTLWDIMCKVRLESYMWGLGTAVGELPPYFMGRAARISKQEERTEILQEFEELERKVDGCPESLTRLDRLKLFVRDLVVKTGFWGVLVCATVPNPFFDLAGITCGNFLVPFWIFFGATLIGKAVIKTTIQQVFVILLFNKAFLAGAVEILSKIPVIGERVQSYFSQFVVKQKERYSKEIPYENTSSGWFSKAYHVFVICTFIYFSISIINSLAQNHQKRLKKLKEK